MSYQSHMPYSMKKNLIEGPKLATRGGVNGSRSKFHPKSKMSAYVPKSPQALQRRLARIAMDKLSRSRRPRSQRGSKTSRNPELACSDQSGRLHRPVRPVPSRQPETKASKAKSWVNEVQIRWILEESFITTPWTYPQKIFPKRLTDREKLREDRREFGFSQEPKNPNSWELAIPAGMALG